MHTLDEINHFLKDAQFFSVFDTTKGFLQVPLDADSHLLTTMLTLSAIYIFNVVAMDLSNSGDLLNPLYVPVYLIFQVVLILLMIYLFLAGHRKSTTAMSSSLGSTA